MIFHTISLPGGVAMDWDFGSLEGRTPNHRKDTAALPPHHRNEVRGGMDGEKPPYSYSALPHKCAGQG